MASDSQLLNFMVKKDLLQRIDDFRFQHRFPTRAGAIKWLLDRALEESPNPAAAQPFVLPPTTGLRTVQEPKSATVDSKPEPRNASSSKSESSHESVIQALKAQGYEVGETAVQDGNVRIVVRSTDSSALVTVGNELHELAAGRLTLAQIAARRRSS